MPERIRLPETYGDGDLESFIGALPPRVRDKLSETSPDKVILATLRRVLAVLIEERQRLLGAIEAIRVETEKIKEEKRLRRKQCICSKKHLIGHPRRPNHKAAARLYGEAKEKAAAQEDNRQLKTKMVKECIYQMARNSFSRRDRTNIDFYKSWGHDFADEIAGKLVEIKNINIDDIVRVLVEKENELRSKEFDLFDARNCVIKNKDLFMELVVILGAKKPIKPYLEKLIHDTDDARLLDLTAIWREKHPAYDTEQERKKEGMSLSASAIKANEYCRVFFGEHQPHPEIASTNDLDALRRIIIKTVPVDEEAFKLMVSAMAKVNMMHLAETIRSQIDFDRMRVISQHLRKKLATYRRKKARNSRLHVLHCCSGNQDDECAVEAISVPDEKSELAIARKFVDKDNDNTRDIEIGTIHDLIRFCIILTRKDSKSPETIEKATKKIIAIITAIFGTDISRGRLRYSFGSGKTNENSTGKHEAFHFTIRFRYQCSSSGKNRWGTYKIKTIPVEVQIRTHMNRREEEADHNEYVRKKDIKIQRIMGMDVPFNEFLTDICDMLLSESRINDDVFRSDKTCEFPIDEKFARILFRALTKKTADGSLVNARTLKALCDNPIAIEKIKKVIKKYKHYEASHVDYLRSELSRKDSKTEFEGWRKKIANAIERAARQGNIVSSINEMALIAEKSIKDFEKSQQSVIAVAP